MPSEKDDYLFWNESFSLVCNSAENPIGKLREQSIVFELRWRPNSKPKFLEKAIGGSHSHILASAEMDWKNILDAPSMEVQTWVVLNVANEFGTRVADEHDGGGVNPWTLEVAIKVQVLDSSASVGEMRRRRRRRRGSPCGCSSNGEDWCCSCADNELLFVTEALEAAF